MTKMDFQKKTGKMKLRRKRSWQDLKKKVVCKTALQVRGQKDPDGKKTHPKFSTESINSIYYYDSYNYDMNYEHLCSKIKLLMYFHYTIQTVLI